MEKHEKFRIMEKVSYSRQSFYFKKHFSSGFKFISICLTNARNVPKIILMIKRRHCRIFLF